MNRQNKQKSYFLIIISSFILFCFSACSMRAEQNSLTSQFETIDALISQNQMQSAINELKKTEKRVYDSWSYIGIYKRYAQIGETISAEKLLKKALKKNSQNSELLAVYTNFLIRNNRNEEAKKVAEKLKGSKYASLYSEIILKEALEKAKTENVYSFFQDEQFYQIYMDAYEGSKNPIWIRNCAVYDVTHGLYGQASLLNPPAYSDADDAFFWALVLYDAGKFDYAVSAVEKSRKFLNDYNNKSLFKTSFIQQVALESDAYMALSEMENAEKARQEIVLNLDNLKLRKTDEELLPVILANSAIWAGNQGMDDNCADLLFYIVNHWPDYVPALIMYSDFAYKSNLERKEDTEIKALRRAGIASLEMEKYDNRRKIPLSDAMYRMDEALKRNADPYLSIAKMDLRYKTDSSLSAKDKYRDLWKMLENNYVEGEKYHMLLVQYAVSFLISAKYYEDAWDLFHMYVVDHGTYNDKEGFWEQFVKQLKYYDLPIVEIGGWFAADQKRADEAIRIYEYCVYESSGLLEDGLISQNVSTASCMNLADIYFSIGKKSKALDLYGKAAGRESNNARRANIFYRIACIYAADGDIKNALRSAEYASSLYPENERASILKDKLKANPIQLSQ